jgi:hypothetical protein
MCHGGQADVRVKLMHAINPSSAPISTPPAAHHTHRPKPQQRSRHHLNLAIHPEKHARAELRDAGIPRPPDHEALLATYLDRQRAVISQPRLCACGCGHPVPAGTRGRPRKYIDETHRKWAQHQSEGTRQLVSRS